jgi:hypothetical protein
VLDQLDEAVQGGQALEAGLGEAEAGAVEPVTLGQDGNEQLLLAGEVVQQAGLGQAGVGGDPGEGGALGALGRDGLRRQTRALSPSGGDQQEQPFAQVRPEYSLSSK